MGIPEVINTDNGPPFNSEHFQRFCKSNGILLKYSPPTTHLLSTNGLAEKSVSTIEQGLMKQLFMEKNNQFSTTMQHKVDSFLEIHLVLVPN